MAFRKVSGPRKFYDFKTLAAGTVVVNNGIYVGAKDGQFGATHFFREKEGDEGTVGLSGGQLNYMVEEGEISKGCSYRITFDGKDILKNGKFKGKEVNQFTVELDEDSEESAPKFAAKVAADFAAIFAAEAEADTPDADISL